MRDKLFRVIATSLMLLFLISIFSYSPNVTSKNEIFQTNIKEDTLKSSKFWNLTVSPISIDDNDPIKNWSYTASHYDWCSGSGNWTDPYVIENVTIDGQGLGSCIEIANSTAYFIIKNCTTYNSGSIGYDAGIFLLQTDNGIIIDNNCSYNNRSGILLSNSCNNTLLGNIANRNHQGFNLGGDSNNNTLWNNTANNNQENGIHTSSNNNTFIENGANNNNQDGIKIDGDNNTILDNHAFNNNGWGIKLFGLHNNASGNRMKNCGISVNTPQWRSTCFVDTSNTVNEKPVYFYNNEIGLNSNNFSNAGQVLLYNCNNSVISNLDISNTTIGISLFSCNNNTISDNIANNNNYFGIEFSGNNNTLSGNILNNNKESGLYLSGSNNQLRGNTMCSNNRNGIYQLMSNCDFNLFLENNISKNGEFGIYLTPGSTDNLFYRNIFYGNGINAEDHGFIVGNNKWDNGIVGNYWGDYNGTDLDDDGIGDSPYNISGNANSQDNFPILDIDPPKITINDPGSYNIFGINAPDFNVEIVEPHIDKMWYTVNNGATSIIFTSNGTINQALWDTLPEGNVTIRFYANDTIGNANFQEIIVVKAIPQPNPPEIPGYDLLLFIGIISIMVAIIIKKRINNLTPT